MVRKGRNVLDQHGRQILVPTFFVDVVDFVAAAQNKALAVEEVGMRAVGAKNGKDVFPCLVVAVHQGFLAHAV